MRSTITELGEIQVLSPEGDRLALKQLWAAGPTIAVWLRHFGCQYCLQQVATLTAALPSIEACGGQLLLIGNGSPEQALRFRQMKARGATVVTDPDRRSYRAMGARRSPFRLLGRGTLRGWLAAMRMGIRPEGLQGDVLQLGATLVVDPPATVLLSHIGTSLGDHPTVESLLAALRRSRHALPQTVSA
ncbi:MAG: AhpC/TSA family protein [Candidatus Dormibacteria bacterium]